MMVAGIIGCDCDHLVKHNVLIISVNMNVQIGKDENNKFYLHNAGNM